MRYRVVASAERDLDDVFLYWARRVSVNVADRIVDRITDRFWLLDEFPNAGKSADHLSVGVKCFPAGNYLIYYRRAGRGTEILHIFHNARDQRKAFPQKRKYRSRGSGSWWSVPNNPQTTL
jgi:toxin ParE1/3/4